MCCQQLVCHVLVMFLNPLCINIIAPSFSSCLTEFLENVGNVQGKQNTASIDVEYSTHSMAKAITENQKFPIS